MTWLSVKESKNVVILTEETYGGHDIDGGRQTCIRIRDKKHGLKGVSEERDGDWIKRLCVHPGQKFGAV